MAYMIITEFEHVQTVLAMEEKKGRLIAVLSRTLDETERTSDPYDDGTLRVKYTGRKIEIRELYFERIEK